MEAVVSGGGGGRGKVSWGGVANSRFPLVEVYRICIRHEHIFFRL